MHAARKSPDSSTARRRGRRVGLLATFAATVSAFAQPVTAPVSLNPVVVTAARAPQAPAHVPFGLVVLTGDELQDTPSLSIDGALRSVPGFSLFRRSDSLSAHPTAQGVSLRGIGPSGASRSLVLLDGIPLNDPFGGWVAWNKVPRLSLGGAEIVRGGGGTAWGNAALGGVLQLFSESERSAVSVTGGDYGTRTIELTAAGRLGRAQLQLSGRLFESDGFPLVAEEDRGSVDIPAASRHRWLAGRWTQPVGEDTTLTFTARTFAERRNNGTRLQRNESDEDFAALALSRQPAAGFSWTALAYGQTQAFRSTFSAVNAARSAETPASDQFAVPAVALGAAWSGNWTHSASAQTSAGADVRRVRGETREHFGFANGDFTRRRVAGGRQDFAGIFGLHERVVRAGLRASFGGRVDWWRDSDGHRDEVDRASGAILRRERYPASEGVEFSPSAGLVWEPEPGWRLRAAAQHAFRRPTLNELYRPFRVGNVITEANAGLHTERVLAGEVGLEWTRPRATLGITAFWNEFRDAVGNVTVVSGPGVIPPWGFIPAGGTGRQRLNLERTRVRGLELSAQWRPADALTLRADYLYNDATVRRAPVAPTLAGKQLAQVPRHSAVFSAHWNLGRVSLRPRVRWLDRQFEDDENLLRLGAALVVDAGVAFELTPAAELYLQAENLLDERIETGRSAAGVVNTGTPRLVVGGFRASW